MTNPFQDRYDACNHGTGQAKWESLADFPRIIDVELTSSCNFRCLMCPTGNLSLQRPASFMDCKVWTEIIDQAREYGTALRFIGWGEPTLHPELIEIIDRAHRFGLLTHLNTNGSKITLARALALVQAGLSSIKFSFQGVDAITYKEMRRTDFFEGMIAAIDAMKTARGARRLPWIAASTSVTYESPEWIETFRRRLEPLVDQLGIGTTTFDYMDFSAVRLKKHEVGLLMSLKELSSDAKVHPKPCPEVYDKLSVHADGSVVVCCNDYNGVVELGRVPRDTLQSCWMHPKIEAYRERLAREDYEAPLCKDCYDYLSLTAGDTNETAEMAGAAD